MAPGMVQAAMSLNPGERERDQKRFSPDNNKNKNKNNITEKIKDSQQGHKIQHNDGKDSFLGSLLVLPVELWK